MDPAPITARIDPLYVACRPSLGDRNDRSWEQAAEKGGLLVGRADVFDVGRRGSTHAGAEIVVGKSSAEIALSR